MQKEERFWDTLKDIFIGTEIDGDSGFVNLMRIKRAYFSVVFKELEQVVNEGTTDSPDFKEELFDKLYSFFKRYFSESGSIYFTYTPLKEQVYEKVYTNVDDVTLFWKTHMLYYVKTDQLWRNLTVKVQDSEGIEWNISFDVSEMQHKQANERRRSIFDLSKFDATGKRIVLKVQYAKSGRKTKAGQIAKALAKDDIGLNEEAIAQAISMFLRQNEVDFFINKDAEGFLKEQFDLWLFKDYLMDMTSVFDETRLAQIKFVRTIAYKVIEFVAKFEEELKKIWNKPKAVLNSNYVITLDRLLSFEGGMELLERILKDDGIAKQVEEWNELAVVDDEFTIASLFIVNVHGERDISENWRFLCIDTKHYDEGVKERLLQLVKNHDEELDGWVIHSENYQALTTLFRRFEKKIDTIFIDPPYNTGQDGFPYKDRFMHASWLSMMENRLSSSKNYLSDDGVVCICIDDHEQASLKHLMDGIFGRSRHLATAIWQKVYSPRMDAKGFSEDHDYILIYGGTVNPISMKQDVTQFNQIDAETGKRYRRRSLRKEGSNSRREDRPNLFFPIIAPDDSEVFPIRPNGSEGCWRWSVERYLKALESNQIEWVKTDSGWQVYAKQFYDESATRPPSTLWSHKMAGHNHQASNELKQLFGRKVFDNPKPKRLVEFVLSFAPIKDDGIILDYFAGSGTTGHAVVSYNQSEIKRCKFILVDIAEYVYSIVIPRLKKIAFSDNWSEGQPREGLRKPLFFKYYGLEQYENVLREAIYRESHPLHYEGLDSIEMIHSYLFLDDRKYLDAMNVEGEDVDIDLERVYPDIDIAETLANLRGKMIKRNDRNGVEFEDGEYISFGELKFSQVRELIWW